MDYYGNVGNVHRSKKNYLWTRRFPVQFRHYAIHFSNQLSTFPLLSPKHVWCTHIICLGRIWTALAPNSFLNTNTAAKLKKKKIITNTSRRDRWLAQTNCPTGAQSRGQEETNAEAICCSCPLSLIRFPLEWEPKWRRPSAFSIGCIHVMSFYRPVKMIYKRRLKTIW